MIAPFSLDRRPGRRRPVAEKPQQGPDLVAAIGTLRLLLRNNARFPAYRHEFDDDMAKVVGVRNVPSASAKTIHKRLEARLVELEAVGLRRGVGLLRNAALLARMLHLTPIERDLVVLAVVVSNVEELSNLFGGLGLDPISELSRRVACALAVDAREVKRALRKDGALRTTKLLDVSKRHHHSEVSIPGTRRCWRGADVDPPVGARANAALLA